MKKIVKSLLVFVVGLLMLVPVVKVHAEKDPAKIYIFYGEGCGYCKGAMEYFDSLQDEYGYMFDLQKLEVWNDQENQNILQKVAAAFDEDVGGVPYIVIGEKTFAGYDLSGAFDEDILNAIKDLYNSEERYDVMDKLDIKEEKKSNVLLYVILVVVVLLEVALLVFAKRNAYVEEEVKKVETKKVVEPKKEEVKAKATKAPAKTTTKKATTKPATKKTTTKKTTTKTTTKKETTKKPTAKKTTTKKTTKK